MATRRVTSNDLNRFKQAFETGGGVYKRRSSTYTADGHITPTILNNLKPRYLTGFITDPLCHRGPLMFQWRHG